MKKSHRFRSIITVVIALIVGFAAGYGIAWAVKNSTSKQTSSTTKQKNPVKLLTTKQIKNNLGTKLITTREQKQASATATYRKALADSSYTLEDPYVKVNPYETSPLTALLIFHTDQKAKVSYTVAGRTENTSITNTVNAKATTDHQVPIMGLYIGQNTVTINVTYEDGSKASHSLNITTSEDVPTYIKKTMINVSSNNKKKMQIGDNELTFLIRTTKESFAVDADGAVRWYSTLYVQHMLEPLANGRILMLTKHNQSSMVYNDLLETDYLGRVYREYSFKEKTSSTDGGDETTVIHHDITELPNHDLLATVSDGSKYIEDTIVIIDRETAAIKKVIDMKRYLPKSLYQNYKPTDAGKIDWLHNNSLDYDANDDSILASNRNQDLTYKFSLKDNQFVWLYSGKKKSDWPQKYQKYVLTPTKGTAITGGQHGLSLMADENNNPNHEDIILYNNNINVTNGDAKTSGKYSEGVKYTIDLDKMSIDQTWAYGKTLGKANFTAIIGYAQPLANDNVLITFGFKNNGQESNIIEVDDQKQVYNLTISNPSSKAYVYRAYRMSLSEKAYQFDLTE